jgi:hypothetical protein
MPATNIQWDAPPKVKNITTGLFQQWDFPTGMAIFTHM